MRIEPFINKDGYRVWLGESEEEQLREYYAEEPRKKLAIELMLSGLRSEEVPRVSKEDIRELDVEEGTGYVLRIWESKRGFRECPIPSDTVKTARMLANVRDKRKDEALIDVTERTIQRWVSSAAEDIAETVGNYDWKHLSAHDLRRTWATRTYYSLEGDRSKEVVMSWGGWTDEQTFSQNYLGRPSDSVNYEMMKEAGLQ